MNVREENLESVIKLLPSPNAPTVSDLYTSDWFPVEDAVSEQIVRSLVRRLLKPGATGIIEYGLNKAL